MTNETLWRVQRATALVTLASLIFFLFFQINKVGPFRDLNPFAADPYDALGSFAIRVALLIGLLTYARVLRLQGDPTQASKLGLVLRGDVLILFAIGITRVGDTVAMILHPLPSSFWENVLRAELASMFLLTLLGVLAVGTAFRRMPLVAPPHHLTPADGIEDLWTLVQTPVTRFSSTLPRAFVEWVQRFESDWLFASVPWLNPRRHPWRFACLLGLFVGIGLTVAQLQEGLPPNLSIGLMVAGIFILAEFAATLMGFAIFGGYLGLRPPIIKYN